MLVLHSWWGLNPFFKGLCERFAAAGFVALAPDLYRGRTASTVEEAKKLRTQTTATRKTPAYKQLIAAIRYLATHDAVSGNDIAVVGFSMGGHWALWLAQRPELPIAATVVFYAARNGKFAQSRSRFQFHFAAEDPWVSSASAKKMKRSLAAAGCRAEYHDYSRAGHWFFEDDRHDAFDAEAAAAAWRRTLEFLKRPNDCTHQGPQRRRA